MEEYVERLLINSLDWGISEFDFWEMTPAEIERAVQSKARVRKIESQEKASYDYILANLIGKYVSIVLGSKEAFPQIDEVYPDLFKDMAQEQKEKIEEQKMELSALRFKQFAQSYNTNFKNKEVLDKSNEWRIKNYN